MHKSFNLGDICKIKELPKADLWTYSFPCQDLSCAGKQAGIKEGTRSGLLLEVERLLNTANSNKELPKYLLLENVKNLVSKRFKPDFDKWLTKLENLGYTNYWKVLNAKDYGIPQNRERVFVVSILGKNNKYEFPKKKKLKLKLKNILEDKVDEKYYLKDYQIENIKKSKCARDWKDPKCIQVGELNIKGHDCIKRIYSDEGISPTLTNMQGGNRQPKILDESKNYKTRKLTPKECWRLMGWKDEQFNKLNNISNTQLYKQAGNGIVINVLEEIFKMLFYKNNE